MDKIYKKLFRIREQFRELQMTSTTRESQVSSTKLSKVKKILEAYRSSDNNTTNIVRKISTRQIQHHKGKSPMMNEVCHMSYSKANEPRHIWTTRLALSSYRSWPSLMLDLFCRYLSNGTSNVIIRISMCFYDIFFSFLAFFSLPFFYCKLCQSSFNFGENRM